jgi:hypothetical protein
VESPLRREAHGGFGKRLEETDRPKDRHRASGRLHHLTWGGTYNDTKDLMHFDLRSGEGAKIQSARTKHKANK